MQDYEFKAIDRILIIMKSKNIKQSDLAKALNINKSVIANWKKRHCNPPLEYIPQICKILDISEQFIIHGESEDCNRYYLSNDEAQLIRLFRVSTKQDKNFILRTAIRLSDEKLYNLPDEEKTKLLYDLQKNSDRAQSINIESITGEINNIDIG